MKIDLQETLKTLSLPLGLIALFAAILGLFGISLDTILAIVQGLVCTFALVSLLINVLKWAGVIQDGNAGRWSALINLLIVIAVTAVFKLYPAFDFAGLDAALGEFARVAAVVFAYIVQIVGARSMHLFMSRGLGIRAFSYSLATSG